MKLKLFITGLCLWLAFNASAQSIQDNRIDQYSKSHKITSSFEQLYKSPAGSVYSRIVQIDSTYNLELRIIRKKRKGLSVQSGNEFVINLSNDQSIHLTSERMFISCAGCGSVNRGKKNGLEIVLPINEAHLSLLKSQPAISIQISTDQLTWTELLEKSNALKLQQLAGLFPCSDKPKF